MKESTELINVTHLSKELGLSKQRLFVLLKEGRLKADYIDDKGRRFWNPRTVEELKTALQVTASKGRPKKLQAEPTRKESDHHVQREVNRIAVKTEEEEVLVVEEHKLRFKCPSCSHSNSPHALKEDGSLKVELSCWACGQIIKYDKDTGKGYRQL